MRFDIPLRAGVGHGDRPQTPYLLGSPVHHRGGSSGGLATDAPPPPHRVFRHTSGVRALGFSPDGKTLAAVQSDGVVRVWDLPTGRTVATLGGLGEVVRTLAFSPDGTTLATGAW